MSAVGSGREGGVGSSVDCLLEILTSLQVIYVNDSVTECCTYAHAVRYGKVGVKVAVEGLVGCGARARGRH